MVISWMMVGKESPGSVLAAVLFDATRDGLTRLDTSGTGGTDGTGGTGHLHGHGDGQLECFNRLLRAQLNNLIENIHAIMIVTARSCVRDKLRDERWV